PTHPSCRCKKNPNTLERLRPILSRARCRMPHVATTERVLPDLNAMDSDRLKGLIVEQHFQLVSHDNEIESLKLLILKLQRMQFGRSSERLQQHIDQLELRLEELETNRASTPASPLLEAMIAAVKPARQRLPAELPRQAETPQPKATACPD